MPPVHPASSPSHRWLQQRSGSSNADNAADRPTKLDSATDSGCPETLSVGQATIVGFPRSSGDSRWVRRADRKDEHLFGRSQVREVAWCRAAEWPGVVGCDGVLATGIRDRLHHRCHARNLSGLSHRLREVERGAAASGARPAEDSEAPELRPRPPGRNEDGKRKRRCGKAGASWRTRNDVPRQDQPGAALAGTVSLSRGLLGPPWHLRFVRIHTMSRIVGLRTLGMSILLASCLGCPWWHGHEERDDHRGDQHQQRYEQRDEDRRDDGGGDQRDDRRDDRHDDHENFAP